MQRALGRFAPRANVALLAGLLLAAMPGAAQESTTADDRPAEAEYSYRERHDPNGIGKFYMGREIARVMGHLGAGWLERPQREREEAPARLLEALRLRQDDKVADIGAGSGYFTFRMADRLGPEGKVYAVDIQPEMLALIERKQEELGVDNIVRVLGEIDDPKLPKGEIDLILMVDVYHEFSHPYEMTRAMVDSLAPGGRLVFVEYRLEDPDVPIKLVHKMSEKQVRKEMSIHPEMRWVGTLDSLPRQHVITFEKRPTAEQPTPES